MRLIEQEKYVVEGGGAVGVAAIMAGLVPELAGKKFVNILNLLSIIKPNISSRDLSRNCYLLIMNIVININLQQ